MSNAIEIRGLRKTYRSRRRVRTAVDGLDLEVRTGGVFGFCGPNGAGKTTTIRCLLGLVRPSAGSVSVLGRPVPEGLAGTMRSIGAIVEAPALFPTMTGRDNLRLLAEVDGIERRRVDTILGEVGLADRAGDKVRTYSLGMRQRLGLAAALLKDPALVVLDEPANGLDPAGIAEVRALLRRLASDGRTVFVSSHLLAEVEQTCDRVAIVSRGRCVIAGPVSEIVAAGPREVLVDVDDPDAAAVTLRRAGFAAEVDAGRVRVGCDPAAAADVTRTLAAVGLWLRGLRAVTQTLEERYMALTAEDPAIEAVDASRSRDSAEAWA